MILFLVFEFAFVLIVGASSFTILYFESIMGKRALIRDAVSFEVAYSLAILVIGVEEFLSAFGVAMPIWLRMASLFVQLALVCARSIFMVRVVYDFLGRTPSGFGMRVSSLASMMVPVLFLLAVALASSGAVSWESTADFGRVLMNAYVFPLTMACAVFLLANRRNVLPGFVGLVSSFAVIAFLIVPLFVLFNSLAMVFRGGLYPDMSMLGFFLLNAVYVAFSLRRAYARAYLVARPARRLVPFERLSDAYRISRREYEILSLAVQGKTNTQIANELFLSPHTVRNHIYNAYQKLEVDNRLKLMSMLTEF